MTALADDIIVIDPVRALSQVQQTCLLAIDYYRHHRKAGPYWLIGEKRFSALTVDELKKRGLVEKGQKGDLKITSPKGVIVVGRLKDQRGDA